MADRMIRIALFQPDIPQNAGTIARLCACLGIGLDIVEPAGFDVSDRNFRRAGMDYLERAAIRRHVDFAAFEGARRTEGARLVLATTRGAVAYPDFTFKAGDIVMMGRESAGAPDHVHAAADARIAIPVVSGLRSLNVAVAAGMIGGEALRQLRAWPPLQAADRNAP